jgi:DNA-binding GntR family transcriptional regulator
VPGRSLTIEPVSDRSNRSAQIFAVIKDRIIRWQYPPGHRFTEQELADEFAASRSPIREALRMLVENGLVDKVPHHGYHVKQPNRTEIEELYDVRLALETFIVERVAQNGLPAAEAERLHAFWAGLLAQLPSMDSNAALADEHFHEALARATGNKTLLDMLRSINERLRFVRMTDITTPERLRATCQQHLAILGRIAANDVAGARDALRGNVEQGREHVQNAFLQALANAYQDGGRHGVP